MRAALYVTMVCAPIIIAGPSALAQSYKRAYVLPEASLESIISGRELDTPRTFSPYDILPVLEVPTTFIPLPVPVDPSDMLMQDAFDRSDFGSGFAIMSARRTDAPLAIYRLVPNVKLDGMYDTGNPEDAELSPSSFALDGSDGARKSGRFDMQSSNANLKTDIQIPSITAQVFMEIQAVEFEKLDFRQIYGRVGNLLGGEYYSSFSDSGTLPQTIVNEATAAGAIADPKVAQLQIVRLFGAGVLIGAALEDPNVDDFTLVSAADVPLQRMPDVVARVRYQPLDAWGSLQVAILIRQFAYEDINLEEHFTQAVSFSSNARFKTFGDNNVRLGVVGGEGAGSRIFGLKGVPIAAGPEDGRLVALQNVGAFGSYQHFWSDSLWSNVAYGYVFTDVTESMPADVTQKSQNGWVNLIWNNPTGRIAIGVEYQLGEQEVADGTHGINHHIQLSLQIGNAYEPPPTREEAAALRNLAAPIPPGEPLPAFPRL